MKPNTVETWPETRAHSGFSSIDIDELNRCIAWFEEAMIALADPEQCPAHRDFFLSEMALVAADARAQIAALTTQLFSKTSNSEPG